MTLPQDKSCWDMCTACFRCENRNTSLHGKCTNCSGRYEAYEGEVPPHDDDYCRCRVGVLRWVSKKGTLILKKYPGNPYEGGLTVHTEGKEEKDWQAWLRDQREKLNDPTWDPINIYDTAKDPNRKPHY